MKPNHTINPLINDFLHGTFTVFFLLYSSIQPMGVLLGRSTAGKQVLVTWAFGVVPSDLSLRGPNMSLDMSLLAVSDETAGSDGIEPIAVGSSVPLG